MPSHTPRSCQVIYPLDSGGHTNPQLVVPPHAAIDLVNSPVCEWTVYLDSSEMQDIGRQIVRWLDARTNGAGLVEAMAHAITDRRSRGHASIELEAPPISEKPLKNSMAPSVISYHEQWRQ